MKPALALAATALLGALAASPATAQDEPRATTQGTMNHAAVVVDTGDGVVRKMCLAFPEAEISGIEALQRVDTRPNRFESFGGKGSGVCMLFGVGCPSGDCFCNPDRYWAYHRAGPGERSYRTSAVGASSTRVRDGDVEAWKWGPGTAPAKTSVSEVCQVPEPPSRTSAATTTTAGTAPTTTAGPTTTAPAPTPSPGAPTPPPSPAPPPAPPGAPASSGGTPTTAPAPGGPEAPAEVPTGTPADTPAEVAGADPATGVGRIGPASAGPPARSEGTSEGPGSGQLASLAAFTALLGGLLVWRSRIRRANVRRMTPVR